MIDVLIFTLFCLAISAGVTWRYRNLTHTKHTLSRAPVAWLVSFAAALVGSAYYAFGSIPAALVPPLLLFSGIAAALAIVSVGFHVFYKKSVEPGFVENIIDFTLFGMQRLLSMYIPFIVLLILVSTQTTTTTTFYFGNIVAAWVGFGAIYGSVHALKKLKIDFD